MIADISKGSNFTKLINYHESKVIEGKATLLENQTMGENKAEYIQAFHETVALNNRVKKDFAIHFSLSLPVEEHLDNPSFLKLAQNYLQKMGYENRPYLVYRHADKAHEHIHIVTTSINFDGEKISFYNDWKNSQAISRELEKEFGLQITQYDKTAHYRLSELNAEKYRVVNSMKQVYQDKALLEKTSSHLSLNLKRYKEEFYQLDDKQFEAFIGKETFKELTKFLDKESLLWKSDKEQLIEKLNFNLSICNGVGEYINNLTKAGLYVRKLQKQGRTVLIYGDPANNFYLKDKDVPNELQFYALQKLAGNKDIASAIKNFERFTKQQQSAYIRKNLVYALQTATSKEVLSAILEKANITTQWMQNKGGTYGLRLSNNFEGAIIFKASEISRDLSYQNIHQKLESNFVKAITNPNEKSFHSEKNITNLTKSSEKHLGTKSKQHKNTGAKITKKAGLAILKGASKEASKRASQNNSTQERTNNTNPEENRESSREI